MIGTLSSSFGIFGIAIFFVAAAASYILLLLLRPLLRRYAMARPNTRSSHKMPTPQGAGIGVIAATIGTVAAASFLLDGVGGQSLWLVLAAAVFIAIVGAIDDMSPIPVLPRLVLQAIAVAVVLASFPDAPNIFRALPNWIERSLLGLALLWFINLFNFMDGIDWMTVAETVPVTAGLVAIGSLGALPPSGVIVAIALCGSVVGFAPLNRPVAKLFLGDVGSLSIGILVGWLLLSVAERGHLAAAMLLPLYYVADATITLFRRIARREPIWRAHRTHFYQRAMEGLTVMTIVGRVLAVNIVLVGLALITIIFTARAVQLSALTIGAMVVAGQLWSFTYNRR